MARDFDKEIANAQARLDRLRKEKEAHDARMYAPAGRAFAEVFPGVLDCKNLTEAREFAKRVGRMVQAASGQASTSQKEF